MTSVPNISTRTQTPYVPEEERYQLRYRLFEQFRANTRYKNVVLQDLRPLWRNALPELPACGFVHGYSQLPSLTRDRQSPRPALAAYLAAVERCTISTLQITSGGKPVEWACAFLHADVEPGSGVGNSTIYGFVRATLTLDVTPAYATIETVTSTSTVNAAEWMRFNEWDDLEREARAALSKVIADMRAEYLKQNPVQRPSTRAMQADTLKKFATFLLDGKIPPDNGGTFPAPTVKAKRERLRRMADALGCDFSTARPQHNNSP